MLCFLLGVRERAIELLFLNGEQINRKIKLIGEAPAGYALREDNDVGSGEVSGGSHLTEGTRPELPGRALRFPQGSSHPVPAHLRRRPAAEGRLQTDTGNKYFLLCAQLYTRGDPAASSLRFLPAPASVCPSVRPSFQQERPCNSRTPCPSLCYSLNLKP